MRPPLIVPVLGGLDPSARAIINAFTTPPTGARKALINSTVKSLKASGVWFLLDSLYILAAADSQAARVDWKRPSVTATVTNSPTFTADRGYTFNGTTQYMDTQIAPNAGANYVHTAAMCGVYERSNVAAGTYAMGARNSSVNQMVLDPRAVGDSINAGFNAASANLWGSTTDSRGLTVVQREDASNLRAYKNGADRGTAAQASGGSGEPSVNVYVGCYNSAGTPTGYRASDIGAAFFGISLTSGQHSSLYTAIQDYMTAVGANV